MIWLPTRVLGRMLNENDAKNGLQAKSRVATADRQKYSRQYFCIYDKYVIWLAARILGRMLNWNDAKNGMQAKSRVEIMNIWIA